jgi:hypothetical protein
MALGLKAVGAYGWQPNHLHEPYVRKPRSFNLLEASRPVQVCTGIALPLQLINKVTVLRLSTELIIIQINSSFTNALV